MTKKYLVSEDQYSGQVVIICETCEVEVKVDTRSPEQAYADMVMGRDHSYAMKSEMRTAYKVKAIYHYEIEAEREENIIFNETAWTREEGNELFKQAVLFCR